MASIQDIANAITIQENAPTSYNNPGALMDLDYYKSTGMFRLKQYGSVQEGWNALLNDIQVKVSRGWDLLTFFKAYAPLGHGSNNPQVYAQNVSNRTGIPMGVPIASVLGDGIETPYPMVPNPSNPSSEYPESIISDGIPIPTFSTTVFDYMGNTGIPWWVWVSGAIGVVALVAKGRG